MRLSEYAQRDALGLAELVRSREVSPLELVETAIGAIERLNPTLNFVSHELYERARAAARDLDGSAPFAGVPFLLKDVGAKLAGAPYEAGSRLMRGYVASIDSNLTRRFIDAGLNIVAKSTTPEFGAQIHTEPMLTGTTRNPWNLNRTPGGSSGGAAAAVAAGVVPIAHANDGLGSIRIPASNTGLFGLKPTRQRTPCGPDMGELSGGRGVEFIVSRSVRDSAALLDLVHGADVGAPHWAPPPERPYLDEIAARPSPLKIAMMTTTFSGASVNRECEAAVRETAALCEELGHTVVEAAPAIDWAGYFWAIRVAGGASLSAGLRSAAEGLGKTISPDNVEPLTWLTYLEAKELLAIDYLRALEVYGRVQREMGAFFVDYDILLTPVLSQPPAPIGWLGAPGDELDVYWDKFAGDGYSPFTGVFNVTGQPAASIPLHVSSEGLPIGTQIVGRFGGEGTIFQLAAQLEAARPWAARRPPVHLLNPEAPARSAGAAPELN
jgi:amidase